MNHMPIGVGVPIMFKSAGNNAEPMPYRLAALRLASSGIDTLERMTREHEDRFMHNMRSRLEQAQHETRFARECEQ
jgi:hypothetical protein